MLTFEVAQKVTPLQCPIHLPHDNTHTLFIASSSLLLPPHCAVPSLAEFVTPTVDGRQCSNQLSEVGLKSRLDKGGVQPKPSDLVLLESPSTRFLATIDRNHPILSKQRSPHLYYSPLFRLCNSILYLSTPWRSVEWYSLSPCVASWTLH